MSTAAEHRIIVSRLLAAWDRVPEQRFGQLLIGACSDHAITGAVGMSGVVDDALAEFVESFATTHSKGVERRAPVQGDYWIPRGTIGREPGSVTWTEHLEAWRQYDRDGHGSQSADRLAERGGYGYSEITKLLGHAPKTWTAT